MMQNSVYDHVNSMFTIESLAAFNFDRLDNANSIFINTCYLFASDTLDEKQLAAEVMNIKHAKRDVPFYILFQNTTDPAKNVKYNNFKGHLNIVGDPLHSTRTWIRYNNRRGSFYPPTEELVYFEILELV